MKLNIKSWAVWMPVSSEADLAPATANNQQPALADVPAMTRRRLSRMTKIAFDVALSATAQASMDKEQAISTIFASRHGDLHKTVGLLQQLAANEELSPSQFALSVHNAISGQYSIFCQNQASSNAIAAGADSLHYALLEAAARFTTEPDLSQLLVVYVDEPVPQPYQTSCNDPSVALGLALLLHKEQGEHFTFSTQADTEASASDDQALQLLPLLRGEISQLAIAGQRRNWHWQRG